MTNVITTAEMFEQFGELPLSFSSFSNKHFVFQGTSVLDIDIMLMLNSNIIYELHANQCQTINNFADLLSDSKNSDMSKLIKIRISHNFANIYSN